eukprot:GHVO01056448.1.p1 GENE.GHVO01056448.1~~GHVO01056448.1.p1  ORF type:complete len:208 (-),score=42.34 GHVO01056448.1:338-931(-)
MVNCRERLHKMLDSAMDIVTELDKSNDQLVANSNRLKAINIPLKASNDELKASTTKLEESNFQLKAINDQLEETNDRLNEMKDQLEETYDQLKATNDQLETTNDQLKATNNQLKHKVAVLEDEKKRVDRINRDLSADVFTRFMESYDQLAHIKEAEMGDDVAVKLPIKFVVKFRECYDQLKVAHAVAETATVIITPS